MRSLWTDPDQQQHASLPGDREVEVAIIGGGLSGLGAAYGLGQTGKRVLLLEERTIASGASGRNAGFILAGPSMSYSQAVRSLGRTEAELVWEFTLENNRLIAGLIDDLDLDCGYLRRGSMSLAASDDEWENIQRDYESLRESRIDCCVVAGARLSRPFDRLYCGGLYYAGNGEMNPARFLRGITAALPGEVRVHERTPVTALDFRGRWHLSTPFGVVHAEQVILATNAYTSRLLPDCPVVPTRGQVLSTEPINRVLVPFPMYADNGFQYWRQTDRGELVVGGWRDLDVPSEVGCDESLHPIIQAALDAFCRKVGRDSLRVQHRWAGIMGFTPDHLPLVGAVPDHPGLWLACGYSGHGVSMAFLSGFSLAQAAAGRRESIPAGFDPGRWQHR